MPDTENIVRSETTIAVVGGGLAAHAAGSALEDEASVSTIAVVAPGRGLTAVWGGLGWIWGPVTDRPEDGAGRVGPGETAPTEVRRQRPARWSRLLERRPYHPYRRLELGPDDVASTVAQTLDALGDPAPIDRGTGAVPGPRGEPAFADLAAPAISGLALNPGERIGVVTCPGLDNWRARPIAERIDSARQLEALPVELPPFEEIAGGHSVRVAHTLVDLLAEDGDAPFAYWNERLESVDVDVVGFPPCLGPTMVEHRQLASRLDRQLGVRWAEWPADRHSVHGWRLDRALRDRSAERFDAVLETEIESLETARGTIEAIETADGTIAVDAAVLAAGRWVDGGLPASIPLEEPLLEIPLWLDGGPLANADEVAPADLLGDRPWSEHDLFRAGLAVDESGRPLGPDGSPAATNAFAAGRALAGFDAIHDDCTMGVELVTGRFAARRAAESVE